MACKGKSKSKSKRQEQGLQEVIKTEDDQVCLIKITSLLPMSNYLFGDYGFIPTVLMPKHRKFEIVKLLYRHIRKH